MKKLSLKNLKLDANDLLQREQLKTVFGGYGNNCCNKIHYDDGYEYWSCGNSLAEAMNLLGTTYDNLGGFGPATVTEMSCYTE